MNQTATQECATTAAADPPAPPTPPAKPRPGFKESFFLFSERFGHMMSRILLTVLYIVLVAPAGVVMTLLGDALQIKRYRGTSWNPWEHDNESLEQARRQD